MNRLRLVYVKAASAVSSAGCDWRGLAATVQRGAASPGPAAPLPPEADVEARSLKLMSHAARLGAVAMRLAVADAGWQGEGERTALYLGVGASGGSINELTALLAASLADGELSLQRFGSQGLAACNPLFAFQLMNNFSLCHGAILCGLGGPNSAFFSRGLGTLAALDEAVFQVASGACERALAGGTDTALHPVTLAQLQREGDVARGLRVAEGAAILALDSRRAGALAEIGPSVMLPAARWQPDPVGVARAALARLVPAAQDHVVLSYASEAAGDHLRQAFAGLPVQVCDTVPVLGDALAAAPALAWATGLDWLCSGAPQRVIIASAGLDGGLGLVELRRPT